MTSTTFLFYKIITCISLQINNVQNLVFLRTHFFPNLEKSYLLNKIYTQLSRL